MSNFYGIKENSDVESLFQNYKKEFSNSSRSLICKKILIVDDLTYNLFVLEELVKEQSPLSIISTAMNGSLALKVVKANIKDGKCQLSLILSDINMPVMDGLKVIRLLLMLLACQGIEEFEASLFIQSNKNHSSLSNDSRSVLCQKWVWSFRRLQ